MYLLTDDRSGRRLRPRPDHRRRKMSDAAEREIRRGSAVIVAAMLILLCSLGVLGYQVVLWLRDGHWTGMDLWLVWNWFGFPAPSLTWQGVQKLALAALDFSLAGGVAVGGIIFWIGSSIEAGLCGKRSASGNAVSGRPCLGRILSPFRNRPGTAA
jgi:hypothetical protein